MIPNPLATMVVEAEGLLQALADTATAFERAIDRQATARVAHQNAKADYDEAEAEFLAELAFGGECEEYAAAKNAEQRKLATDRALIRARQDGELSYVWQRMKNAEQVYEDERVAYDQLDARFKAQRVAADLQASMLRAAAMQ